MNYHGHEEQSKWIEIALAPTFDKLSRQVGGPEYADERLPYAKVEVENIRK